MAYNPPPISTARPRPDPPILNILRRTTLLALGLAAALGIVAPQAARAHHLLPQHEIECSADFPCHAELEPRIHFWIEVFRSWGAKTAILHDPDHPQRVYAVFDSGRGCHRAARASVERKREQVKSSLRAIAAKVESGQSLTGADERHLAALFPANDPGEIRAAAENIRCQSGVRDQFIGGLRRYNHYRPMVEKVLAENDLPREIRYLPFVESSYNPAAYSKAGAAGIWQIMPTTARVLGLELNATLDERFDPEAATRAAALYFKRADRILTEVARESRPNITRAQINPFIITSYNYGVNGMTRAIRQVDADFIAVLERYKSPAFQTAVRNFYASFLAASHVADNAERYFGVLPAAGGSYHTVVLQRPTSMARIQAVFALDENRLRPLNGALTRFVWRGWRLIPAGYRLRLPARQDDWRAARATLASLPPERVISGGDHYTVRRGDTACGIARAVQVNCSELILANRLGRRAIIRPGQKLLIPGKLVVAPSAAGGVRIYRVRRGDTACAIARRFGVNCRQLISHNRLGRAAKIYAGQKLSIPGGVLFGSGGLDSAGRYTVRRGDTACAIAERFGVGCRLLIGHNRLGRTAKIYAGQKLSIPGGGWRSSLDADNRYIVRKGDSACRVAQWFSVGCGELLRLNELDANGIIHPGQRLKIPGLVVADTSRTARQLAQAPATAEDGDAAALLNLLDTLPDLAIRVSDVGGEPVYAVRVEADETLGHFADWLGVRTSALRDLNRLRGNQPLAIGRRLLLPVEDANMAERFEQRRSDYHQVLIESLKEHYDLVGVESYIVRRGDSPWSLSTRLGFPVWLLYHFNPALRGESLQAGQVVSLPRLREKA